MLEATTKKVTEGQTFEEDNSSQDSKLPTIEKIKPRNSLSVFKIYKEQYRKKRQEKQK